jgi:hypothetical protein
MAAPRFPGRITGTDDAAVLEGMGLKRFSKRATMRQFPFCGERCASSRAICLAARQLRPAAGCDADDGRRHWAHGGLCARTYARLRDGKTKKLQFEKFGRVVTYAVNVMTPATHGVSGAMAAGDWTLQVADAARRAGGARTLLAASTTGSCKSTSAQSIPRFESAPSLVLATRKLVVRAPPKIA